MFINVTDRPAWLWPPRQLACTYVPDPNGGFMWKWQTFDEAVKDAEFSDPVKHAPLYERVNPYVQPKKGEKIS
jgi:hypothetical protein